MLKRPSIKSPCVADRYAGPGERIAEFSAPNGKGGLISIRQINGGDGVLVSVYRTDPGVAVAGVSELRAALGNALGLLTSYGAAVEIAKSGTPEHKAALAYARRVNEARA